MRVLVLCSGGLDSTVLYYYLKSEGHEVSALSFYYGSKHNKRERRALKGNIEEVREVDIDLSFLKSALLQKEAGIPKGHYKDESMRQTVVPFRNGIILSYAIALAESEGFDAVAIGNHSGDHAIYPDCRVDFIKSLNEAARVGTNGKVTILSPFVDKDRKSIVRTGVNIGIEDIMAKTYSCYEGNEIHCGACGACNERKEVFKSENVKDQTEYKE